MDLKAAGTAVLRGCYDSIRGMGAVFSIEDDMEKTTRHMSPFRNSNFRGALPEKPKQSPAKKKGESRIQKRIWHCSFMNGGVFLFSIFLFNGVILPGINWGIHLIFGEESFMGKLTWLWIEPILSFIFTTLWVIPLFLLSKAVNSLWFQDIADSAYRYSRGRPLTWQSVSKWIADSIFSIAVQTLFLIQALLVSYIPIYTLGYIFSLIHMCLLYSLYAFEYKWFNMGWELHRRLTYIEKNWPYFLGFGLPLALLTEMSNSWIVSGGIFSLLFPFFIISGNEASPIDDVCIYPLRLFSPVIAASNMIFSKTIGNKSVPIEAVKTQQSLNQTHSGQKYKLYK